MENWPYRGVAKMVKLIGASGSASHRKGAIFEANEAGRETKD